MEEAQFLLSNADRNLIDDHLLTYVTSPEKPTLGGFKLLFLHEADPGHEIFNDEKVMTRLKKHLGDNFSALLSEAQQRRQLLQEGKKLAITIDRRIKRAKKIILALDGGGIRGLATVSTLIFLSKFLFGSEEQLTEIFDWAVGTSVGSIIATGLITGKPLSYLQETFLKLKDKVFAQKSKGIAGIINAKQLAKSRSENLRALLTAEFGDSTGYFSPSNKYLTVVAADITFKHSITSYVFRNYGANSPSDHVFKRSGYPYLEGMICSASAPHYFKSCSITEPGTESQPPKTVRLVDGGLVANCPLLEALNEYNLAKKYCSVGEIGLVLSIGTGKPSQKIRSEEANGIIATYGKLFKLFLEAATQVEETVTKAKNHFDTERPPVSFVRFSPDNIDVDLDETDNEKLADMMWKAQICLLEEANKEQLRILRVTLRQIYRIKATK